MPADTTIRRADVTPAGQALAVICDRDRGQVTTVSVAEPHPRATTGGSLKLAELDKPIDTTAR
ncbi:hypothetical protein [Streptomyces vietnamensis]|uniref:hypothetical protein n=1 Tax=Streptomyces vietnamensis TaxID=362257 RepID=UPI00342D932B